MWLHAALEKFKKNYTMNFPIISISFSDEQFKKLSVRPKPRQLHVCDETMMFLSQFLL